MGRYARAGRSQAKMTAKPEKYPQGRFKDSIRNLKSAAEYLGRCNDYRNHGESRKGVE